MCCDSSLLAVPSKCNFPFLQTELSHSAALCSGTVAVPSKQKALERCPSSFHHCFLGLMFLGKTHLMS